MKAAVYDRYGPPEVVRIAEVPKPVPADNEVLVRVRASTVCAADWRFRKADPFLIRAINGLRAPKRIRTLGMEVSGTVDSVGKAVSKFHAGDLVFGGTGLKFGAHAEYACAREVAVEHLPSNLPLEDAAGVVFGGLTALCFLRKAKLGPGQKVLVHGASSSCGVYAVQLAKHFGATVTGVCSGRNVECVRSLGADRVLDYTREDYSAEEHVFDVIFDCVGKAGFAQAERAVKRGGTIIGIAPSGGSMTLLTDTLHHMSMSVRGAAKVIGGVTKPQPEDLRFLRDLFEAGRLRTVIDCAYPLEQIVEAHRLAESGRKRGHVLVLMGD